MRSNATNTLLLKSVARVQHSFQQRLFLLVRFLFGLKKKMNIMLILSLQMQIQSAMIDRRATAAEHHRGSLSPTERVVVN